MEPKAVCGELRKKACLSSWRQRNVRKSGSPEAEIPMKSLSRFNGTGRWAVEQGRPCWKHSICNTPAAAFVLCAPFRIRIRKTTRAQIMAMRYLPMDSKKYAQVYPVLSGLQWWPWVKCLNTVITTWPSWNSRSLHCWSPASSAKPALFTWYGRLHRYNCWITSPIFCANTGNRWLNCWRYWCKENVSIQWRYPFWPCDHCADRTAVLTLLNSFVNVPVIVAGGTWPDDEEEVDHYANTHPEFVLSLLTPDWWRGIYTILTLFKHSVRFSKKRYQPMATSYGCHQYIDHWQHGHAVAPVQIRYRLLM